MSFIGVAAGVSAATGIYKIGKGIHQNNLANKVVVPEANYETSPYAVQMLDEANRLKDSRMTGAADAERGIYGSQANATGAINRNATSGAQALAMLAATQGNSNNAFNSLRMQEGQDQQMKLNNFNNASGVMINEGDKVYQDALRKRQEAINEKNALRGAGTQNIGGGMNDLTNDAFMMYSINNGDNSMPTPRQRQPNPGPLAYTDPVTPYNPPMANSTGYINPNPYINK
jgi:hypothetical protein